MICEAAWKFLFLWWLLLESVTSFFQSKNHKIEIEQGEVFFCGWMGWLQLFFFLWVSLYLVVFFFLLGQHECVHSHNELQPHFTLHFIVCMGLSTGSHTSELRYVAALYSSDQAWLDGFCNSLNPSFARFISWVRRQQTSTAIAGYGLSSTNRRRVRNYILLIVQEMYRHYGNCYLFPFLSRVK